jgi:sarcosine oxidase subunit delta
MLLIPCPICGRRPEPEFTYAGEAHIARPQDPAATGDADWTAFLYGRTNVRGEHAERWRHTHGCGKFFNAVRNTVTDRFVCTYPAGSKRPGDPALETGAGPDAPETRTDTERWGSA